MVVPALRRAVTALVLSAVALPAAAMETPARVATLRTLEVADEVDGDVFVLAGDLVLQPGARVHGHAIALFGRIERQTGATVDGRILAVESLANLRLASDGPVKVPQLDAAVRILSSGGWLVVTTALAFLFPARMGCRSSVLEHFWLRALLLGVLLTVTLFVALVAVLGLGATVGTLLAAALMMVFLIVKAVGLTVCGAALGGPALARWPRRLPLSFQVFVGVACLLLLRVLPVLGGPLWTLASVVALGAGLLSLALGSCVARVEVEPAPHSARQG